MNSKQKEIAEAKEMLLKYVNKGDTIYTVLRHVSRSGMQRRIDLFAIKGDNYNNNGLICRPVYLSGYAAKALGIKRHKDGGIIINGCGMDMGFELVYRLSCALYCPDKYDHDAAYSLKHEWI